MTFRTNDRAAQFTGKNSMSQIKINILQAPRDKVEETLVPGKTGEGYCQYSQKIISYRKIHCI